MWAQETWKCPHVVMFHSLGAVKNHTGIGGPEPEARIAAENAVIKTCHRILAPTRREKETLDHFLWRPSQQNRRCALRGRLGALLSNEPVGSAPAAGIQAG